MRVLLRGSAELLRRGFEGPLCPGRLSEAGELPKHMVDSYTQLQARTLGCMATACGGLAAAACALQSLGHGMAARPNMEAVVQALLRNPLAQITTEVRHPPIVPWSSHE